MNSRKLQESIADDANLSLEKVDKIMETMVNVMLDQLKEGTSVSFQGFGAFEVRKKEQRLSVNPLTKKRTIIPPKQVLVFRTGNTYKDKIKDLPHNEE